MKKGMKLLIALCTVTAAFSTLAACAGGGGSQGGGNNSSISISVDTSKPEDLKLKTSGRLSWDAVEGATYEVSVDGTNWVAVEEGDDEINLLDIVTSTDVTKVYVRACNGNKKGEAAEFPITVERLGAPGAIDISMDNELNERRFIWDAVEGAYQYEVLVTIDGESNGKWVQCSYNYYTPTETGVYSIKARCRGFAEDNTLYIPGDASDESDEMQIYLAPNLQSAGAMNRIFWSSAVKYDSYNLTITDKLGKTKKIEGVSLSGPDLDLVTSGYITKTGEYDLQLEGVKDGEGYWSKVFPEFQTSNINQIFNDEGEVIGGELFSFDNRYKKMTQEQAGLTVTNEQYFGKTDDPETNVPGQSLKVDGADPSVTGQMNIVKYAYSGINDIDFRDVTSISYKIFIPAGQKDKAGNEITSVAYTNLPSVRWERSVGEKGDVLAGYVTTNFYDKAQATAPVGEWHEVNIDCALPNDRVLILTNSWICGQDLVCYIDEIMWTGITDRSATYDARTAMKNAPEGTTHVGTIERRDILSGWGNQERIKLSFGEENANKQVVVSMKVKGTAPAWDFSDENYTAYAAHWVVFDWCRLNTEKTACSAYLNESNAGAKRDSLAHALYNSMLTSDIDTDEEKEDLFQEARAIEAKLVSGEYTDEEYAKYKSYDLNGNGKFGENYYQGRYYIPNNAASQMDEWMPMYMPAKLNDRGEVFLGIGHQWTWSGLSEARIREEFNIYLKDVELVEDFEYFTQYGEQTAKVKDWLNPHRFTLDFGKDYANKTVALTMDVKGNVAADNNSAYFGFGVYHGVLQGTTAAIAKSALLATNTAWTTITLRNVALDANGKVQLAASNGAYGAAAEAYEIYVKNVTAEEGTWGESKTGWFAESGVKSDAYGATLLRLYAADSNITANYTTVRFSMKVKGTAAATTADSNLRASFYANLWAMNNGNVGFVNVVSGNLDAALRQDAQWMEVTIETQVNSGGGVLLNCAWAYEGCNGTHTGYHPSNPSWTATCPLGATHKNAALNARGFSASIKDVTYLGIVS